MLVQLSVGSVNRARGVEVKVWALAGGNDFTSYLNRLNCAATSRHPGWAFFAPIIHPRTEARRELKCRVLEAWVGLLSRKQFVIGTITFFPSSFCNVIHRVATQFWLEGLTVVTLVGKPGTSTFMKLFFRMDKTGIGDHPLCFSQVLRLFGDILFTVMGVWWEFAFGKKYFIRTPRAPRV